ncbi:MAG: EAL domain-containing protein [Planctomycetes bacterium]|nr:EAL domain-containing protein [Planctomycetota bacterium]
MIGPIQIKEAIASRKLHFWYQPKVSFLSGRICGCEALIRWRTDDGTILPPSEFLPQVEKAGMMTAIAQHMFTELCIDIPSIIDAMPEIEVSFNLTAQDLEHPGMIGQIKDAIANNVIQARNLQIELTETAIPKNQNDMLRGIQSLLDMGVQLAMDDFGTGYSSLDALHRLPFDVLKIDQSVIKGLPTSVGCAVIVNASIRMAYEMGLTVVAEGVETEAIFEHLLNTGCTQGQGYFISKPLPLGKFMAFLGKGHSWITFPFGLIRHAEIDHVQWRKTVLEVALSHGRPVIENENIIAHASGEHCRFGRWLTENGGLFSVDKRMRELVRTHTAVHNDALHLLERAKSNINPNELLSITSAFSARSDVLLHQLQELALHSMLQHFKKAA